MCSKRPINIGILGAASIAVRSVVPSIVRLQDHFNLTAIASNNLDKLNSLELPIGCKLYDKYEDLACDDSIEAVYIPLPNGLHYYYAMMCLMHDKHLLVEKSLGCTFSQVLEMTNVAKSKNLALLENFQFVHHSQLKTILEFLRSGKIGELRSVRVSFGFPPFADSDNIRYKPELGGGALLDAGVYALKICPLFLGNTLKITQATMIYDNLKRVDVLGFGTVQQKSGSLFCQFSYGFDTFYQCSLELLGTAGKLTTNRIFTSPSDLKPVLMHETCGKIVKHVLESDNHFEKMLRYFYCLVDDPQIKSKEFESNLIQAKLIEEFKSISTISDYKN
ncbi:MAG: Gfo/Idh/MocA family oxidoreductase [Planctomycetes bacterium]|nr:Gfo/Idh/MocA family oxidoreductase [Planctomycetota bacterium]